jgi:6-phosphofructo-2-kinase/fructose-2,6-biphosphatase 2
MREDHSANFFQSQNKEAVLKREELASECLEQLIDWLKYKGGNVGIHGQSPMISCSHFPANDLRY